MINPAENLQALEQARRQSLLTQDSLEGIQNQIAEALDQVERVLEKTLNDIQLQRSQLPPTEMMKFVIATVSAAPVSCALARVAGLFAESVVHQEKAFRLDREVVMRTSFAGD